MKNNSPIFQNARASITRHPLVFGLLVGIAVVVLVNSVVQHHASRGVCYLVAVALSFLLIEIVMVRRRMSPRPVLVRNVRLELLMLGISFAAGFSWLYARFVWEYRPPPGPARLAWLTILLGCVFNAAPALVLITRRYGVADLGLRVTGASIVLPVIAVFAATTLVFSRSSITWSAIVQETGGTIWGVVGAVLSAAVPEEFFRFVWQTRVAAWRRNHAAGWVIASFLWASLHGPKDWQESHSLGATVISVLNITPLGLLWGHLTYRSRSILPSILAHGVNVWGLQNLS